MPAAIKVDPEFNIAKRKPKPSSKSRLAHSAPLGLIFDSDAFGSQYKDDLLIVSWFVES
jgi:hypothetical protein